MEKTLREKQFQTLLKGLNIVFSILLILTRCVIAFFLVLLIGAVFTSEQFVMNIIKEGRISASIHIYGLEIILSEPVTNILKYDKKMIITLVFLGLLYGLVIYLIFILVNRFLKSILNGEVFTLSNSKRIEWIALCILLLSVSLKSMQTYFIYTISELLQLNSLIQETELVKSISYQFLGINWSMLLCGIVIWTIGRMFRYGSFLQGEFDSTV